MLKYVILYYLDVVFKQLSSSDDDDMKDSGATVGQVIKRRTYGSSSL